MEKKIDIGSLKINQLGYVYKDVEKQAKIMESVYGMPKFAILEDKDQGVVYEYRGKDSKFSTKIAFSRFFNQQIELIQWIEGECIFKEFIHAGKEGLHHFGIFVTDLESIIEEFQKKGFEVIFTGYRGKQHVAYVDTEESFGILLEFQETLKRRKKK